MRGYIGLALKDRQGRHFGIGARHILARAGDQDLVDEFGSVVGQYVDDSAAWNATTAAIPFHALIGRIALHAVNHNGLIENVVADIADPSLLKGQELIWTSASGDERTLTFVGQGSEVGLADGSEFLVYYNGPLLFECADRLQLPGAGESGALVRSTEGRAVGVVIAVLGQRVFVAALKDWAAKLELTPIAPRLLLISVPPQPLSAPAALMEARTAVTQMRDTLTLLGSVHRDPGGHHVPKHLLEALA